MLITANIQKTKQISMQYVSQISQIQKKTRLFNAFNFWANVLFVLKYSFRPFKQFFGIKTVDSNRIWTPIVGIEGEHTDHLPNHNIPLSVNFTLFYCAIYNQGFTSRHLTDGSNSRPYNIFIFIQTTNLV